MENRIGNFDGSEIPKMSRSLDLKTLYKSGTSMESQHKKDVKRKISKEDCDEEKSYKRKKSSKTVSLSRLTNVDNSKRSGSGVSNGAVSSGSHDLKSSKSGLIHNSCSGFNGISFRLDDSGIRIPKRKRGFVGRKKAKVSQVLNPPENSCSKVIIVDQAAKVTGDHSGTRDNSPQDSDPRFKSLKDLGEQVEPSNVKCNRDYDDFKENRNCELNSAGHLEEEGKHANHSVVNHGESSLKKEKRKSNSNSNRHFKEEGVHAYNSVFKNCESSVTKPNGVGNSNSGQCLKEDDEDASHTLLNNSNSSLKKTRRNMSKRKDSSWDKRIIAKEAEPLIDASSKVSKKKYSSWDRRSVAKEAEPLIEDSGKVSKRKYSVRNKRSVANQAETLTDTSGKVCDKSLEDEENLEENAAMMLSSRFDPSCTGFSSNGKSIASTNWLSSRRNSGSHESSLLDAAGRELRPRTRDKEKGQSRKRRHYYEIFSVDLDVYWVLNQRIKVFWPLDQCWYYGLVGDYDKEKKLHHIKYDDRDEEWINLENERFKLLLLPTEVPVKAASRRSRKIEKSLHEEKGSLKSRKERDERNLTSEEDNHMDSYMDSEPIISWLARSTRRVNSSPSPATKKQKISDRFPNEVGNTLGCLDAYSMTSKFSSKSELLDRFADGGRVVESASWSTTCSKDNRLPIVYYRRRFHKTGSMFCSTSSGNHLSSSAPASVSLLASSNSKFGDFEEQDTFHKRKLSDGAIWSIAPSNAGFSLTVPLIGSRKTRFEFSFPVLFSPAHAFGAENLWLAHAVFLLHCGKLMAMWPSVLLEMLFVDNLVGLRYFLFEGCLKKAVAYVFLVLTLFHQPNEQRQCADLQLPITSIRFKFSCFQNPRKQFVFAFYNFAEVKNSTWMYMDCKLKSHCLLTRQLPLSECTYDNIKVVENGSNRLFTTVCRDDSSTKGSRRMSKQGSSLRGVSKESFHVKVGQFSSNLEKKRRNLSPYALSFSAAPAFFISLHLKLLMEHSRPGMSFQGCDSTECPESDDCLMADDICNWEYCLSKDSERTYEENASECTLETDMSGSTLASNVKVMLKEAVSDVCLPVAKSELEVVRPSVWGDGNWTRSPQTYRNGDSNVAATSANFREPEEIGIQAIIPLQKLPCHDPKSERCVLSPMPSGDFDKTEAAAFHSPLNGIRVEIPAFDQFEKHERGYHSAQCSTDLNGNLNGRIIPSPNPTAPRSTWHRNGSSSSLGHLAHGWSDGKVDVFQNNFGNAPKKPRTQVSYSLPFGVFDYNPKNRINHQNGLPHTRIRKANEKRLSDVSRGLGKSLDLLSCDANVLITRGDKGWRECGAQVVLELFEHNKWKLAVKLSGTTGYSYKAHHFLQPGSANRYTHAMMWKGGKDWMLEFPDRSQWTLFKEMHEECYNRNIRAASVKNIPIPGVCLIEKFDENGTATFVRNSSKYFRQVETDVEMALVPSRVLYDMDSDDEEWILKIRSSVEAGDSGLWEISEELFEKIMDMFEKAAYSQQRDEFTSDEIEELMVGIGSTEAIKVIYEYWRQKKLKKGMPLIRHLQPPLWEKYQQQVKEWEQVVSKANSSLPNGCESKVAPVEKPPMFAFCLKPRGLEVPNKCSKHRSHRKVSVCGQSNTITRDHDFYNFGRRLSGFAFGDENVVYPGHNYEHLDDSPLSHMSPRVFSPRVFSPLDAGSIGYFSRSSDVFDRNQYQKLQRSKSKKFGMYKPSHDTQMVASYNQRLMGMRDGIHRCNTGYSEWPSERHFFSDWFQGLGPEMLDGSDLDEFKLRDASGATQHARNMAKLKRERAKRFLNKADLAIHKAVNALMIAEAVKTSFADVYSHE